MTGAIRPLAGAPRPYAFPTIEGEVLRNGLRVLVVPMRRLPVATALLMSDAGTECDLISHAGVAALTIDAMAEGTRRHDAEALAEAFEQLGGSIDTAVSWAHAEVSTTVLTMHLPSALRLLAEVVREPSFPEGEISRLREERLAELLQQRTEPRGLADDMFARFVFAARSRYAVAEGGDEQTVARITRDVIVAHHARFVVPTRSVLIVAGDVDPVTVIQQAEAAFGGWIGEAGITPDIAVATAHSTRQVHVVGKPDSSQSELRVGHLSVPRSHPDYHALSVMNAILGGLFNSRLNLNLRETHAYTYGAFSHFDWRRHASSFEAATAVQSDVTAAAVREILAEIDRMRDEAVRPAELSLAVDYLTGVFPIRFETTAAIANALVTRESYGLPVDYFDSYRGQVAAVTATDVLRVAREHLDPSQLQIVAVGDPDLACADLEALHLGPVHQYDASGTQNS